MNFCVVFNPAAPPQARAIEGFATAFTTTSGGLRAEAPGVRFVATLTGGSGATVRTEAGPRGWGALVGSPISLARAKVAETLEAAVREGGVSAGAIVSRLDGVYAAILASSEPPALTIVTDPLGLQPVFCARAGERIAFASTMAGAARAAGVPFCEDLAGTGALLILGHLLGDRTPHAAVRRVPPATIVRLDGGAPAQQTYWRVPTPDSYAHAPRKEHTERVRRALDRWYDASRREYPIGTLMMSGGFDSRVVAGLIASRAERPHVVNIRHRDENADADGALAKAVATALRWPVDVVDPSADYFDSTEYKQYVALTEGATGSLFLFIATLGLARIKVHDASWDGLLLGFLNVARYETLGFPPYLAHLTRARGTLNRSGVFEADWLQDCVSTFGAHLAEEQSSWPDSPQGVLGFGLRNRARLRFGPNAVDVLGRVAPVHIPGATREFWEAVSHVPASDRSGGAMHVEILQALAPALTGFPVASGEKLLAPSPKARHRLRVLRLRAEIHRRLIARPRLRRYAAPFLGTLAFNWADSRTAMADARAAADAGTPYRRDRIQHLIAGRDAVSPGDSELILVLNRFRAVAAFARPTAAAQGDPSCS